MTAVPSIDPALTKMLDPGEFLHEQLAEVSPDLMRELLRRSSTRCLVPTPTPCAAAPTTPGGTVALSHCGKLAQQIFLPAASRRVSNGAVRPWKSVQGDLPGRG